eukprot:11051516-Lingulodinium_polyedra.AAC.1
MGEIGDRFVPLCKTRFLVTLRFGSATSFSNKTYSGMMQRIYVPGIGDQERLERVRKGGAEGALLQGCDQ